MIAKFVSRSMQDVIDRLGGVPAYRIGIEASHTPAEPTTADAVCSSLRRVVELLSPAVTVTYTSSGFTGLRAARERPAAPIIGLTPHIATARRLAMVWGVHAVPTFDVRDVGEMVEHACAAARKEGFAQPGDDVVVVAGLPFGSSGATNLLHVARIAK